MFAARRYTQRGMCRRAVHVCLYVSPFVCLSVTFVYQYYMKKSKHILELFIIWYRPIILVFLYQTLWLSYLLQSIYTTWYARD